MKTLRALKIVLLWVCLIGVPVGAFWMGGRLHEARHVCEDIWSRSSFAQLKVALESYYQEHGAFPPTKYQPVAGGPIHSWRVLLVPYTSSDERHLKYDFTQEWNSTNNLEALSGWPAPNRRIMPSRTFRMLGDADGDIAHCLAIGEDNDWPSGKPLKSVLLQKGNDQFLLVEDPDSRIHWLEPKH